MNKLKFYPIMMALLASILFGASAPITKMLLGEIQPIPLASFLYLGSGIGLLIFQIVNLTIKKQGINEASLNKRDFIWLFGAIIFGGIIAPIILLSSLKIAPASTASLLLNFEGVATTIIAIVFFKENVGKQILGAIALITIASIVLSWDFTNQWGLSIGALGIIIACLCWGIDNNFTRNISSKNPFSIVTIKGIAAGIFSLVLSIVLKNQIPDLKVIIVAMIIGFFCYGLSIVLFVFAMRDLGSARTSALFATAPFIGSILSIILLGDIPSKVFFVSLPIMIIGAVLLLKEEHVHKHKHESIEHEHRHNHNDGHHDHEHRYKQGGVKEYHSHLHTHNSIEHTHPHLPDIHHRHVH
ncbi:MULTISPECIES: DMT family transporter [unclassified Clostridium]|uniref:DMT family transporter n=1 Tax=unclassified Clostridium TaxID=2614128 RepID=UPI000297471E|nr:MULTISPECIES: DMT family transporter [unclassified Clostridium]EKQ55804.1 MAG: DMT(drug/metabolite transporter) superfamily permease [Clostridium sp. Maddingley MBC34-26]